MTRREMLKDSSATIWTLIKLQFRAGVRLARAKTPIKTALKWLMLLVIGSILLGGFIAVYFLLARQFVRVEATDILLGKEFLVFSIGGFQVLQTLFLIPMLIKVLDLNNDRDLLLKLPISSRQIFISKIIVAYMFELVFAAVVLTPILIAYGIAAGAGVAFFCLIPVLLLFVPVLPFFIATLVMFPVLRAVSFLRNRSLLTIGCYLAGLVLLIVVYMEMVHGVMKALADDGFGETLAKNAEAIQRGAVWLYPAQFFAGLAIPKSAAIALPNAAATAVLNFVFILIASAAMIIVAFAVAGSMYKRIYMDERVMYSTPGRKRGMRPRNATAAVVEKDILNIFRSSNYTFQFLLIVVITPLLVYFCNRTAAYSMTQAFNRAGQIDQAQNMIFGVSMLVIMILIPLAACFAASNISREGYNIGHTKLIPVTFRKQLFIKAAVVFVPILISVTVSCCLTLLKYPTTPGNTVRGLTAAEMLTVFGTAVLMCAGYVTLGTYLDLKKPVCNQIGAGELTKSTPHINLIMGIGVLLGAGLGILGMFSGFTNAFFKVDFSGTAMNLFYLGFAAAFAITGSVLLFVDGPRKYERLEQ